MAPINELINLSETPLAILPPDVLNGIQTALETVFFLIGGFIGVFLISFYLRWRQMKKLQKRLDEIDNHLEYLTRRIEESLAPKKKK